MKRSGLEHLLRAVGRVISAEQIIVVGSQAILATIPEFMLPPEATMSVEADIARRGATTIDPRADTKELVARVERPLGNADQT